MNNTSPAKDRSEPVADSIIAERVTGEKTDTLEAAIAAAAGAMAHPPEPGAEAQSGDVAGDFVEDDGETAVTRHPRADRSLHLRIVEAVLFAAAEPLDEDKIRSFLPEGADVPSLLADLLANYANRGVNLMEVAGKWTLRTADDLAFILRRETTEQRKLSKAALETLAIVAYHQPVTRAEIEDIRGVAISKGTLDMLMDIGWVRMRGRRRTPGRPVTYGTTEAFLSHFGLSEVNDLPGLQELKGAGLLEANLPPGFDVPIPRGADELTAEEDPLDGDEQAPLEMHLPDGPDEAAE